jgi:hypothetical protein
MVPSDTPEINLRKKVPSEIRLVGTLFLTSISRGIEGNQILLRISCWEERLSEGIRAIN